MAMSWRCFSIVVCSALAMRGRCFGYVLDMFWRFVGDVVAMFRQCVGIVSAVRLQFVSDVLAML